MIKKSFLRLKNYFTSDAKFDILQSPYKCNFWCHSKRVLYLFLMLLLISNFVRSLKYLAKNNINPDYLIYIQKLYILQKLQAYSRVFAILDNIGVDQRLDLTQPCSHFCYANYMHNVFRKDHFLITALIAYLLVFITKITFVIDKEKSIIFKSI